MQVDADVIVGHDIVYDVDELLWQRIAANKIFRFQWSKLGRLKCAAMPKFGAGVGRLMLATMVSAKELIRCHSYDLTEVMIVVRS